MDNDPSSMKELFVEPQKGFWLVSECSFHCHVCHVIKLQRLGE
jgi:hypothetical protein